MSKFTDELREPVTAGMFLRLGVYSVNKESLKMTENILNTAEEKTIFSCTKYREEWVARVKIVNDRAVGNLFYGDELIRNFNVSIKDGKFSPDIGTGSGVKVSFKVD
jgi:hypothetical protein